MTWTPDEIKDYLDAMVAEQLRATLARDAMRQKELASARQELERISLDGDKYQTAEREALRREMLLITSSTSEAIEKAEVALSHRLDLLNGFRAQAADEASRYLPREVYEQTLDQWSTWRSTIDQRLNEQAGQQFGLSKARTNINAIVSMVIAALAVVATVVVLIVTHNDNVNKSSSTCYPSSAVSPHTLICK